jgi:glyoxylase-like metal-dependent hydrolase (beta-lactamase superfamily II)
MGAVEIAAGVHAIDLPRVRVHAILEPELTLIDAGLPGSRGRIARYLEAQGLSLDELRRVICTHGHPDHAGGVREIAGPGVEVCMHPADYAGLQVGVRDAIRRPSRGRIFASITPVPPSYRPVEDGDVLPVLGGLRVVHTPGHTPGSICLYAPRERLLFTGDVLQRRRGAIVFASQIYSDDHAAARRSVQRLAELDVDTIIFSHFPPLREHASAALAELARQAGG